MVTILLGHETVFSIKVAYKPCKSKYIMKGKTCCNIIHLYMITRWASVISFCWFDLLIFLLIYLPHSQLSQVFLNGCKASLGKVNFHYCCHYCLTNHQWNTVFCTKWFTSHIWMCEPIQLIERPFLVLIIIFDSSDDKIVIFQ